MIARLVCAFFVVIGLFSLASCASTSKNKNFAPVIDLGAQYAKQRGYYTVSRGESLYLIAWRLDMDYNDLARINHLKSPYAVSAGMRLKLSGVAATKTKTRQTTIYTKPSPRMKPVGSWIWPAKGKVINKFSTRNKGINIAGKAGEPVRAAAAGKVVYAGNGLSSYGNLLIIKHNNSYLSAYAHNKDLLVHDGSSVKQGQVIAHMGRTGTNKTMLHFEIRKNGKPVNPLRYLH